MLRVLIKFISNKIFRFDENDIFFKSDYKLVYIYDIKKNQKDFMG